MVVMMSDFNNLSTVKFNHVMKPAALRIYEKIFDGCKLEDLRDKGFKVHILDKEFGIDSLIHLPSDQWISIQEKYRSHSALSYLEFTQEYKNGAGTKYENDGEWFKLGAQVYFYGWANKDNTDFEKWVLIDIAKYKMLVEEAGGLDKIGNIQKNKKHGRASFYCIPIMNLKDAFITDYRDYMQT